MLGLRVLLCILLIKLHTNSGQAINTRKSCNRADGCETTKRNDNTIYFGLMLSFPDPLGRKGYTSNFDDGHDIAPAAYLAVEQINNQSDLLSDYQVQLIPVDGGCTVTERTVVGINNLACSCEPIVGIVGPSCDTSALRVGQFTGRDQFPMVTIHYGELNVLGNREMFPFAFGILGSNFMMKEAFTVLIMHNYWTRVALLYSGDDIDLAIDMKRNIKSVAFTSPIYEHFIPLQQIRQSFARVIIVLSSIKLTLRTLCIAYHEGMIFPRYQWVFKERFEDDFQETSFNYGVVHYSCSEEAIKACINKSFSLVSSLGSSERSHNSAEYEQQRFHYNTNSISIKRARGIYDAVWSLAFALNSSLEELNRNLTEVVPGSKMLAQAVANQMFNIDFEGESGRIKFDKKTGHGFNTARQIYIHQFEFSLKSSTLIGLYNYTSQGIVLFNSPISIVSTFSTIVHVSAAVVLPFLIITVAILLFTVPIQVINIIYRNHPAIKASSPNLNHLIFLGCFLTVIGTVLYITTEYINNYTMSNLCKALPWFLSIGTTLVIGTVCTKTWRLYYVYSLSKKVVRSHSKTATDPVLGAFVGVFISVDVLLCLVWTCIDPLIMIRYTKTIPWINEVVITETAFCHCNWLAFWITALILYKSVLIVFSFILALFTRMKHKEFKTNNVIILSYILAVTVGLGMPIIIVILLISDSVSIRFVIVCVFVDAIIYICLFALFLPSVVLFLMEKVFHRHYNDKEHTLS